MAHYYDDSGNIYKTQLDAVFSKKDCKFYFYDDEFEKVNWKTAPKESLKTLYKERAEYIRDNYEYVLLCYSGGADSTNALEAFYYNNIHIDEILIVGAFSKDSYYGSDENHNGDIYHNVYPTLKKMNMPNTKITIVDYTKWFDDPNNFTLIKKYGGEWTKHIGSFRSVHNLFWYDLKKFVGANNDKNTAVVMGADKTKITDTEGDISVKFCDLPFTDYGWIYKNENFNRVNFHIDIDDIATKIVRKQAHTMLEVYKTYSGNDFWVVQDTLYKNIVYNLKNPLLFESKKSVLSSLSARDMFITKEPDTPMFKAFAEGLNTIRKYGNPSEKYSFTTKPYFLV